MDIMGHLHAVFEVSETFCGTGGYWEEQHFQTSSRLHLQHWIWQHQLGYTLHPSIPIPSTPDAEPLRIADIACGNCAWILEASRTHPTHIYTGFDTTSTHFPHPAWLPSNIDLRVLDPDTPVPQECRGAFDIVHLRGLACTFPVEIVESIVQRVQELLKPGGHLQWEEVDPSTLAVRTPGPGVQSSSVETLVALQRFFLTRSGLFPAWLAILPSPLADHGFEVVEDERVEPKPELMRAWGDSLLSCWMGKAGMFPEREVELPEVKGLPGGMSRDGYGGLVCAAAAETERGVWVGMETVVVVARAGEEWRDRRRAEAEEDHLLSL